MVRNKESDLFIVCDKDLKEYATVLLEQCRQEIEQYIRKDRQFISTLSPYKVGDDAPEIIKIMCQASKEYSVGPMASVAGVIAEWVGRKLLQKSNFIIVENGGDIFLKGEGKLKLGLYAGDHSPFTGRLCFEVNASDSALGVCTSSGTVGHSLSFGNADAVVAIAKDTALADAAATAIGNTVKTISDIEPAITREKEKGKLEGLIIAMGKHIGFWGNIQLTD